MKSPAKQLALIEKIREDIAAGRYRNDLCLPTEAEYSVLFHVSRQTVRKALNFVLADKVDTVLETALVHKDADNKHEVIMPVSGKKSRPEIRQ